MPVLRPSLNVALPVRAAARHILDLLLPPRPLDEARAGQIAVQSLGLAAASWSRITFFDDPVCDGCGTPFEFDLGTGIRCVACQAHPPAFDRARAACLYDEHSRDLILKLKHADRVDLAPLFARWLARAAADLLTDVDAIAPVPLHRGRLLSRRYNQAAEIARPLARQTGRTYLPDALSRTRATQSQGGKSGQGRRRNVAGVFTVPPRRSRQVAGRRILLVDDVLTTGATLEGCARALKAAGAQSVAVVVIARVKQLTSRPI